VENRTVTAIMNGFVQTTKSVTTATKISPVSLSGGISVDGNFVSAKDLGVNRTMLDYYAV